MPGVDPSDGDAQLAALREQVNISISQAVECAELEQRSEGVDSEFVLLGWDTIVDATGKVICQHVGYTCSVVFLFF